jgi:hypothetical protein
LPQTVRRRDSASPFLTTDSKTSSSQEAHPSTGTIPTSLTPNNSIRKPGKQSGYGSAPSSPIVYWSEFETPEEEPYTVPVNESSPLIPWLRRKRDLERGQDRIEASFLKRSVDKILGAVEFEVKTSADGLTTLFYEKVDNVEVTDDDSEDSSDEPSHRQILEQLGISRAELLNRGYVLCVVACVMLSSLFGMIGLILGGSATGIAFVLIGFLISMTLELVSLVRFIMYVLLPVLLMTGKVDIQGSHGLGFWL